MKLIKNLLCLGVFGLAVYSLIIIAMPYYRHYALKNDLKEVINFRLKHDEMTELIHKYVEESGAPIEKNAVVITFSDGNSVASLSIKWQDTINLFGLYQKVIDFSIELPEKGKAP